jgi:2'-hydroxyisoflavone reductase
MPYIQHKASSERALFAMHRDSGFPVTTVRPPFVHGPRQPSYRELFFWDRMLDGRPIILPDGGDAPMQWVFAPDVAEACVRAIEVAEAAGEAFNVGHVEPTTQRGFVEALAWTAGVEPTLVSIPRATMHANGGQVTGENLYFGEVLDMQPLASIVDKAGRVLGLEPTPLDEALRVGLAWCREQPRRPVDYAFEDRLLATA